MNRFIWIKFNFLEKWFSSPDGLRLESVCSSSVFITLSLNERFLHPINFLVSHQNSLNCKFHLKRRLINYPIKLHPSRNTVALQMSLLVSLSGRRCIFTFIRFMKFSAFSYLLHQKREKKLAIFDATYGKKN